MVNPLCQNKTFRLSTEQITYDLAVSVPRVRSLKCQRVDFVFGKRRENYAVLAYFPGPGPRLLTCESARRRSSNHRRRLGHITKQRSSMLRFLMVEAAQVTVRSLPEWRSQYFRLVIRRGRKTKVAVARRLAIRLYWMWRQGLNYEQLKSSVRTQESPDIAMVCSRTSAPAPRDGSWS